VQKKLAFTQRIVILAARLIVCRDVSIHEEKLIPADLGVRIGEICLALPERFDLGAYEGNAGL